ncbi:MAG: NAD(P)-dependent oxidoreductase [Bifidobacterium sp.]|nr:NAD(P)-dependent oxidoreductase [Bifidobacterium sp.]
MTATTDPTDAAQPTPEQVAAEAPHAIEIHPERTDLPLLVVPSLYPDMVEPLEQAAAALDGIARVRLYTDACDGAQFVRRAEPADALIVINVHLDDAMLRAIAKRTRVIAFGGTGVASYVDFALATELDVRVCNVRHYGDNAVAEFTFALMLELARHVGELDRQVLGGGWEGLPGEELSGKTLAIVGLGGIGRTVACIANAFGMRVTAWDSGRHDAAYYADLGVTPVKDMRALFAGADVVSFHMPLNPATRGMVTLADLDAIRPGAMLINTARAEIIAPGALVERLERGDIAAGLDVFDDEPLLMDSPLRTMRHVVLTPHTGWRADGANRDLLGQCVRAVASYFQGGTYNVVVDGAKGVVK